MNWTDHFVLLFNDALGSQFYIWPTTGILIVILSLFPTPEPATADAKRGVVADKSAASRRWRKVSNLALALLVASFPLLIILVDASVDRSPTIRGPMTLFLIQPLVGLYLIDRLNASWITRLGGLGWVIAALLILQLIASLRILMLSA